MKKLFWQAGLFFLLTAFAIPPREKITIWLIGDSTIARKLTRNYPETGWGMPFTYFFDSTVTVENRALNGRSTKSFREEKHWQPIYDNLKEGDYVLIQFGHNDEVKEKVGRYTTPDEFRANLNRYIAETRSRKAYPILITPVARRAFDSTGAVKETHPLYTDIVREVAAQTQTPYIDLNAKSQALLQRMGAEGSKLLFNHLERGEHPNYPDGKADDTHFNELGARLMAQLVLADLRKLDTVLAARIVNAGNKK